MNERNNGAGDVIGSTDQEPEALDFVRFCHRRKHVGWPELYDEMCAVAGRGLYRGYGAEELAEIGIGLGLFQMPALAGLVARVVAEDIEHRRRIAESVRTTVVLAADAGSHSAEAVPDSAPGGDGGRRDGRVAPEAPERSQPDHAAIRLAVPAGA